MKEYIYTVVNVKSGDIAGHFHDWGCAFGLCRFLSRRDNSTDWILVTKLETI